MKPIAVAFSSTFCTLLCLSGCSLAPDLGPNDDVALSEQGPFDTVAQAIVQSNDSQINGSQINGSQINGLRFNGVHTNGLRFNGVELVGTAFHGVRESDGSQASLFDFEGVDVAAVLVDGEERDVRIEHIQETETPGLYFYEVLYDDNGTFRNICGGNQYAIPMYGTWDEGGNPVGDSAQFTFACRGAALAKCAEWGYERWGIVEECDGDDCMYHSLMLFHQACTRLVRADYCGDGTPHTENGTIIDVWDAVGLQNETPDSGLPLEAEWGPNGATCIRHTRWADSSTENPHKDYILEHCPERWAGPDDTECGGDTSTFHSANGLSTPLVLRSLLRNGSQINLRSAAP